MLHNSDQPRTWWKLDLCNLLLGVFNCKSSIWPFIDPTAVKAVVEWEHSAPTSCLLFVESMTIDNCVQIVNARSWILNTPTTALERGDGHDIASL